ncbi:MAG TPA: ABC transporter substrate-binding protein [Acidimicrobiales bacterium]|nr:ABC transporter substrate-binding protein [Acidimicrobiales bacterium]
MRRLLKVASIAMLGAVIAAGCGSSGGSSGTTSASGGSNSASAPGVTANSILLGSHQPLTGPAAPGYSEIAPATNAYFQYVNANGGVNGRKITYNYQDDAYNPSQTATVVRKLVLQDNVFAIIGGLGTPTHEAVQGFLNTQKVPDLFVESGCGCWNDPQKYPYTTGFQPNYTIEGKILGKYVASSLAGQKVAYVYQNDDVGSYGTKGLDQTIPKADVVARQPYDVANLTAGLGNQINAAKAAGAQVVVLFAIPAAVALALLAAAEIGYHPTFVSSSIGTDPPTLNGLLSSFSKGKAGGSLENGMVSMTYLPNESDSSNAWIKLFHQIHDQYDASQPWDGNTVFGMSLGYSVVQAIKAAGKNLTRQGLMDALNSQGSSWKGPGLVPFGFSKTDHNGYVGGQIVTINNSVITGIGPVFETSDTGPINTYSGGSGTPPSS